MARAGIATTVFERNAQIGGACTTAEVTLPGFRHDLGSCVYPMGVASPFFRSLPIDIPWLQPDAPCAHPLDDGTAVILERSIEDTISNLDAADAAAYRSLFDTISRRFDALVEDILQPMLHVPPSSIAARQLRARGAVAGVYSGPAALQRPARPCALRRHGGAFRALAGGTLLLCGRARPHRCRPRLRMAHPARRRADPHRSACHASFAPWGGRVESSHEVTALDPSIDVTLTDVTPRQLLRIAGGALPASYRKELEAFRYGAGAFKVDYALSDPIPWTATECRRSATVHVCGSFEEVLASERTFSSARPLRPARPAFAFRSLPRTGREAHRVGLLPRA